MAAEPTLQPGAGFHLKPDGNWEVKDIPPKVLTEAKFSGYLTIEGYRSTVFETPDKEQWAQKSTGTVASERPVLLDPSSPKGMSRFLAIATRVAKGDDIVSQIQDTFDEPGAHKDYDDAIVDFVEKMRAALPAVDSAMEKAEEALEEFKKEVKHSHPRVQKIYVTGLLTELEDRVKSLKQYREDLANGIASTLDSFEAQAKPPPGEEWDPSAVDIPEDETAL